MAKPRKTLLALKFTKFSFILTVLGSVAGFLIISAKWLPAPNLPKLIFDEAAIRVEIADDLAEQTRGLSGRESLCRSCGMFFIFDSSEYHAFWMKDMQFAIDIIWLDSGLNVVDIAAGVTPETYPASFAPRAPAKYVLELNAGRAGALDIEIGEPAIFKR